MWFCLPVLHAPKSPRFFSLAGVIAAIMFAPANASAQTYSVVHDFCRKTACVDGLDARGGLIPDGAGGFYGTTTSGGTFNEGTVFDLVPVQGKWKLKILYNFCAQVNCTDGAFPQGRLILDTAGNLYGTTVESDNSGIVFRLEPNSDRRKWKLHVLYSFCQQANCTDGAHSYFGLAYAGQSNGALYDGSSPLYGTTLEGGAGNEGVVFQLAKQGKTWLQTVLYSFCTGGYPCTDGDEPNQLLVQDAQHLLGVVPYGGPNKAGAVFELTSAGNTWTETTLYGFCAQAQCADGAEPNGSLLADTAGNLYGTTYGGGNSLGYGVVYKLAPNGTETVLHAFCSKSGCPDGSYPIAGLIMNSNGSLFGTTPSGGNSQRAGVAFEWNGKFNVLYTFCSKTKCRDGSNPDGDLVQDSSGDIFGLTGNGGTGQNGYGGGVAFELIP